MRYQDQLVKQTQKAADDICRSALAVPLDKSDWAPGGEARSALNQMQEVATQVAWFLPILRDRQMPDFDEHARKEAVRIRQSYDTVEKCVAEVRRSTSELSQVIATFPDSAMEDEITLPFGGGMVLTMADVLGLPYWNMVYHLGQINQIQLLLGDREMH
ncbi:MAG: hypothetical protein BGO01_14390 [Armatimonadetes bacterium 55-13]|nr:hypothetical protein [Armatimonadota bacterium]OJU64906.1 MAG: hypothetical protein BGO01_14390 [Armatimonadetes bacterium 55-13]